MSYLPSNSPALQAFQAFGWRPELLRPYESLWSIFRKLARLNATTAAGVIELLKSGDVIKSKLKSHRKLDLLRFGLLDRAQLTEFLQLESGYVYQASALAYLKDEQISSLASKWLRFCAKCLSADFHSPLHQFLFLKRCPGHKDEQLIERCPVCDSEPVLYDMGSVAHTPVWR